MINIKQVQALVNEYEANSNKIRTLTKRNERIEQALKPLNALANANENTTPTGQKKRTIRFKGLGDAIEAAMSNGEKWTETDLALYLMTRFDIDASDDAFRSSIRRALYILGTKDRVTKLKGGKFIRPSDLRNSEAKPGGATIRRTHKASIGADTRLSRFLNEGDKADEEAANV